MPDGYKLISWHGYGLPVPAAWDVARYRGDHLFGSYRVENLYRPVVDVAWWPTRKALDLADYARQRMAHLVGNGAPPAAKLPGEALVLRGDAGGQSDVVAIWQHENLRSAAMMHVHVRAGEPGDAVLANMLAGIRVPVADGPVDWAALDFHIRSPAGYALDEASLAAGMCQLTFRRRRARLGYRRYSAAGRLLQAFEPDAVTRWLRFAYADAFHDRRYQMGDATARAGGFVATYTATRRGIGATEWHGLFPRFRRSPRELRIKVDETHGRVECFERNDYVDDVTFGVFADSAARQELPDELSLRGVGDDLPQQARARCAWLRSKVRRVDESQIGETEEGMVRLVYAAKRPRRMRLLRLLAAQPLESTVLRNAELDALGTYVWQRCAGEPTVLQLIESVMRHLGITAREAAMTVTQYIEQLAARGVLKIKT